MHLSFLLILTGLASALPSPSVIVPVSKHAGPVVQGSYIVQLKSGASRSSHLSRLSSGAGRSSVTYHYNHVFDGYAARLDAKSLDYIRRSNDVEAVFEDGIVQIESDSLGAPATRSPKLSHQDSNLTKRTNGSSVDIYEIGTGIYLQHSQFGGRAVWGATFGGYQSADGNGCSTHLASIAAGSTYGIATQAKLIAVKFLSDAGSGANSDAIAGINWVISAKQASGRPSIALAGFAGGASTPVDTAVNSAISSGIHFVVASGNSNVDASSTSPARVPAANTVGAVDSSGKKATFSNYGSVVDVYYYGVNILGSWIGSPAASNRLSGGSAAAAGVAGILALAIDRYGNKSPAALSADLKSHAKPVGIDGIVRIAQPW